MPQVVLELLELVEDDDVCTALGIQLMALVEDFLDVGLAARGCDDFSCDCLELLESLLRHFGRKDCYALAAQKSAVVCSAAAVVAG